jgi:hypothetical protein
MSDERSAPAKNPILSLLASSAGVSGLLVVVGFFIQQGIRSIIGVSARGATDVTSYLIDVAYFVEDTLGSAADHAKELVALMVIAAIACTAFWLARKRIALPELARNRNVLAAAVMLAVLAKLLYVDWPVIVISDFFRKPATESRYANDHASGILGQTRQVMWLNLLRAHDADKSVHQQGRGELEDAYAMYAFLAALIIIACLALLRAKSDDVAASMLVCAAIMQLLLLAYAYGKFERSTFYPCVELTLREPASPRAQKAFLMSEDPRSVTIFSGADDRFHRVSWSEISQITLIGEEDVFAAHIFAIPSGLAVEEQKRLADRNERLRATGQSLPRCLN